MDVSIIIVNYNCSAYILDCLRSVFERSSQISFEIVVVDNNSTDNSLELIEKTFPQVRIVRNEKNIGFGAANNNGAKYALGKYLLLLNPDTILLNNAVKIFFDYAETANGKTGAIGGNLLDDKLVAANLGGNFPSLTQIFSDIGFRFLYPRYYQKKITVLLTADTIEKGNAEIDYVCGADLFIKKDVFDEINGFDEDYFLYYEDTDLCFRLKKLGYKNIIIPEARIIHLESASTADDRKEKINKRKFYFFENGKQIFFRKSYGLLSTLLAKFLTIFYLLARCIVHRQNVVKYLELISISLRMKIKRIRM